MGTGIRFQRANIVVADLERSLRVYRDILGMTIDYQKESASDSYSYPVFEFPREAKLRFCTLSIPPDQVRTLAITEVTGTDLPPPPIPRLSAMVLRVDAMDDVLAQLAAEGLKIYPEEQLKTQDGRIGREVGVVDHDGHLFVLYTITAGE